ncbi:MAG: hypothetical protein LBJ67_17535, partial [Planctomycetaceae bacterium]|nr:hypothetical protein [Planctomycetaceae bacterium]
ENPFVSKSVDQAKPLQTFYDPPKGIVLFQSCAKGELSYEDGEIKQGFFTHYLVEGLEGKAKDKNGNVTLFSLASYVTDKTQRRALEQFQAKQRPYLKGETADFVLFGDEEPIQLIQVDAPRKEMIEALKMESYATYALKNKKEGYEKDITKTRELLNNSKLPQDFRELSLQIFDGLLKENPGMEFVEKFQKREELLKKKYGINYMEEMMKAAEELQK